VRDDFDGIKTRLVPAVWNPRHDDYGRDCHRPVLAHAATGLDTQKRSMKTLYRYRHFILGPIIIAEAFLLPPQPFFKELQISAGVLYVWLGVSKLEKGSK
jgi:hypothetical protein